MTGELERILAIDPSSKGLGYAVFEGSHRLIDWGLVQVASGSAQDFLERCDALFIRFDPDTLVVENARTSQRGHRARKLIEKMILLATVRQIRTVMVSRNDVRRTFEETGVTKWEIAVAIARQFPELEHRLPRKRDKAYMTEDERMNIFDATAFILALFDRRIRKKQQQRERRERFTNQ